MVTNEPGWLLQLEKGEDQAFQEVFRLFYAPLGNLAFRFTGDRVIAEDIVQEVLYELWIKKLHFDHLFALKAYLYQVVRSRCLDILKHRKVQEKYFREQGYRENSEFFFYHLIEEEIYALLKEAITTLPEQTAQVFKLVFDGYDNTEIARLLHLSMDAVKSHKKRGKKILQEKLKGTILWYILFRK